MLAAAAWRRVLTCFFSWRMLPRELLKLAGWLGGQQKHHASRSLAFWGDNEAQWETVLEMKLSCAALFSKHPCIWLLSFLLSLPLPPKGFPLSWYCSRTVSRQAAEASPNLWGAVPGAAATISPSDCRELPFSAAGRRQLCK